MKYMKNKYIKYKKAELERFLKDKKSCVKKLNREETLAVSPHHLTTIKNYITCVLNAKIGKHHRDLDGIVLDFRNVKVMNTNSELRFEDPLIRINIIVDYYVFRPHRGAVLRGVIKHTNQHSLGVILYRVFTVSIKLAADKADKPGKRLAINQEVEFKVSGFNFDNKFASIDGDFIKAFELPSTAKVNGNNVKKFDEEEEEAPTKVIQTPVVIKQEPPSRQASSDSSSDEEEPMPSTSEPRKVVVKKEVVDQPSDSSSDEEVPEPPKKTIKQEIASPPSSDSSSEEEEDEAPHIKQEPPAKRPIVVKREPITNGNGAADSSSSEEVPEEATSKPATKQVKKERINGHHSDSSEDEISALLRAHKVIAKTEPAHQRKRKRDDSSDDSDQAASPPAKRSNADTFERIMLAPVRRKLMQSESDSDNRKTSTPKLQIKPEKMDAKSSSKKTKKPVSDDEDDLDETIMELLSQSRKESSLLLNGTIKKEKLSAIESSPSILKVSGGAKKKKQSRKSVKFSDAD